MGGNLTQYVVFPSFRLGATVSILRQRVVCEGGEGERRSVMEALVRKVPDDQQVRVASLNQHVQLPELLGDKSSVLFCSFWIFVWQCWVQWRGVRAPWWGC